MSGTHPTKTSLGPSSPSGQQGQNEQTISGVVVLQAPTVELCLNRVDPTVSDDNSNSFKLRTYLLQGWRDQSVLPPFLRL